ncbi:6-bladed beta-propeller [Parabacteroides sp. PF5-9]|uniref:6-bladed beta-propeller n=1 Tax=Parabacteroides sp. PF5-9 TaxID=1742404 RepID=UPI002474740E|nr:6-bladed beta-propeller [Parabacteroides sp. PF5-9]MDH6359150.1 hypothetical protein [Parabacteroides sp. PF5-9]
MKKSLTIIATILFVMAGCERNKQAAGTIVTVDVTGSYPEKELILQDFMDVEYIPLETTDEFITHGVVMDVGKEFIIVKNRINDGNIFFFDRKTGKAIRKINRFGQGGEEYAYIAKIVLDEASNELFVKHAKKISVYDLYGNFKRSFNFIDTNSDYTNVFDYDRDNLIVYNNIGDGLIPDQSSYHVIISKQDGSITREIPISTKGNKTLVIFGENDEKAFPIFDAITLGFGNWILMNISSDTIYTYSPNDNIKPFIVRTPSVYSMDTEVFLFVEWVTDRYYFMTTMKKEIDVETMKIPLIRLAYDKQEGTIFKYTIYNDDCTYKRPVFWTSSINHDIATWYPFQAPELTEAFEKGQLKGRLNEIAAELDEESNPVIMLVKYKNNK